MPGGSYRFHELQGRLKEHPAHLVSAWGRPSILSGLPFFPLRGKRGRRKTIVRATLRASATSIPGKGGGFGPGETKKIFVTTLNFPFPRAG
jgi:hypothetical protein